MILDVSLVLCLPTYCVSFPSYPNLLFVLVVSVSWCAFVLERLSQNTPIHNLKLQTICCRRNYMLKISEVEADYWLEFIWGFWGSLDCRLCAKATFQSEDESEGIFVGDVTNASSLPAAFAGVAWSHGYVDWCRFPHKMNAGVLANSLRSRLIKHAIFTIASWSPKLPSRPVQQGAAAGNCSWSAPLVAVDCCNRLSKQKFWSEDCASCSILLKVFWSY